MRLTTVLLGAAAAGGVAYLRRQREDAEREPVRHAVTVTAQPEEVRSAWAAPGRLPETLAQVTPGDSPDQRAQPVPDTTGLRLRVVLSPAPADRGTEIRLHADGEAARSASPRLREELRRLKAVLECGESVTVEGQPAARGPGQERMEQTLNRMLRRGGRG